MFKHFPSALLWLLLIASIGVSATTAKHPRKHAAAKPAPVITPPPEPPTPTALQQITLQQMPATPAQVQYANSQLTITARNSTMSDILGQVKKLTGASMDFPSNAAERVVGQFGPGPAREVLASLLDGTNFNYVLLGSAKDPNGVDRVIVTVKPTGPEAHPQQNVAQQDESEQEGLGTADADQNTENPPPDDQGQQPSNDADQNAQQGPKTPEQLLQELQRQQQLQQQMQQRSMQSK